MTGYGRHAVRWSKADETFEMACDACLAWLPLTAEYWVPKHGYARCRACYRDWNNARQRAKNRARRADPAYRASEQAAMRAVRRANRDAMLAARRAWYAANRERLCQARRAAYARRAAA